jgi:hypothetical protein
MASQERRVGTEDGREFGALLAGEEQVVGAEPGDAPLGFEPGEPHRWLGASGEDEVAVRRERVEEVIEEGRARRAGGDLVDVVEDDSEGQRGPLPDGVGDSLRTGPSRGDPEESTEARREVVGVGVGRLARQPHVEAAGQEGVLREGLGEGGRLAVARRCDDRDDTLVEPAQQRLDQPWSEQRPGTGFRRLMPERPHRTQKIRRTRGGPGP